jgi:secondary thiamine-phosphate synthase enzyme
MNGPKERSMKVIDLTTKAREEIVDITAEVASAVKQEGLMDGLCLVYVPHTTAGVSVNENADPTVKSDVLMTLKHVVPDALPYRHSEGNSPAHVKAVLAGSSVTLIVEDGRMQLGTWQGVYFCEFDGPRRRQVWIKFSSSAVPGERG